MPNHNLDDLSIEEYEERLIDLTQQIADIRAEKARVHAAMERKVIAVRQEAEVAQLLGGGMSPGLRDALIAARAAAADSDSNTPA